MVTSLTWSALLSGSALKLVDGRCRVQCSVALVDLAVWTFLRFSPKLAWIRARTPWKDPHGGQSLTGPGTQAPHRYYMQTIGLILTTTTILTKCNVVIYNIIIKARFIWHLFTAIYWVYKICFCHFFNIIEKIIKYKNVVNYLWIPF